MTRTRVLTPALILACALQAGCSLQRGLSTPDERAKVVELTRSLERDPLAADAPANRQWIRRWVIEIPEIKFYWCEALLGHGLGDRYPYAREVNQQAIFAAATFAIEHPDKARDADAQYHAGVDGALRVYEVLVKSRPDARSTFLDQLVEARDRGQLPDRVTQLLDDKCPRSHDVLIANLAGGGVGLGLGLLVAWWSGAGRGRQGGRFSAGIDAGRARRFQRIVLGCVAYFLIALIALHILGPEFDPRVRFMSEYALGPHGWLMTTTFFVLGLAAFVVGVALRDALQSSRSSRIGCGLLMVGALFICLAGLFKDSILHLAASVVVFPSMVMALFVFAWTFRQASGWQTMFPATLGIALGMLAAFVGLNASVSTPGLHQRAFILLFLLWLTVAIRRFVRVKAGTG